MLHLQTSCYFQAIAANVTLRDNLCYNGPRAGINWNDGFAGNNRIEGNLVFNMVRETGDQCASLPAATGPLLLADTKLSLACAVGRSTVGVRCATFRATLRDSQPR